MSTLGEIKADCSRDEARMDSQHEKVDKLTSESGEGRNALKTPNPISPYAPPPQGPNIVVAAVAMVVVIAVVLAAVLVFLILPSEGRSPTDVYKEYVDASNDRDIRRMFDQTVTRFNYDYEQRLENLSNHVFYLDPEIEVIDLGVTYRANLSDLQEIAAQVIMNDVETELPVTVDDYCYVHYTINVDYREINQNATFSGEVLCTMIGGDWYLVVPGYY